MSVRAVKKEAVLPKSFISRFKYPSKPKEARTPQTILGTGYFMTTSIFKLPVETPSKLIMSHTYLILPLSNVHFPGLAFQGITVNNGVI